MIRLPSFVIYVDESFFQFWGLRNPDDNFCYLAFGLPIGNLKKFETEHQFLLSEFQRAVQTELVTNAPLEIKSTLFRQLGLASRRRMALRLRNLMLSLDCFFLAEFSQVQGFILEAVRSDLLGAGTRELPTDWALLYKAKRQEFLDDVKRAGLGQSPMLERLISLPSAALAHYLALRAKSYEVFIDPRDPTEDKNIAAAMGDYVNAVAKLIRAGSQTNLISIKTSVKSEQCPGLQIADLLAGEVRRWFVDRTEVLEYNSGRTLLSKGELKDFHFGKTAHGTSIKPERRKKIPSGLNARLRKADTSSLFPYFQQSLANRLISCIAKYGEFRHIDFARAQIIDSPDDAH